MISSDWMPSRMLTPPARKNMTVSKETGVSMNVLGEDLPTTRDGARGRFT
jgi:hypothetical protein